MIASPASSAGALEEDSDSGDHGVGQEIECLRQQLVDLRVEANSNFVNTSENRNHIAMLHDMLFRQEAQIRIQGKQIERLQNTLKDLRAALSGDDDHSE